MAMMINFKLRVCTAGKYTTPWEIHIAAKTRQDAENMAKSQGYEVKSCSPDGLVHK